MTRFRSINLFLGLIVAGLIALTIAYGQIINKVDTNQQINTNALCSLRFDLQTRVNAGNDFLSKNPHGIPGISAPTLRASINSQQHTINALSIIQC